MTALRELLILFFERLGFGPVAESYLDCIERLNEACGAWYREHPGKAPEWNLPEQFGPVLVSGGLDAAEVSGLCRNGNALEFVRFIDQRTNYEGTLLQLQVLLMIQWWNSQAKINSDGGQA